MPLSTHFPLSSQQREIWFSQAKYSQVPLYNIGSHVKLRGELDPVLFERAVNLLIQKHDILRTVLTDKVGEDGLPLQTILPRLEITLPVRDFSAQGEAVALEWMKARFLEPFTLSGQPLFRYDLLKTAPQCHYWLMQYHHIIADGYTHALLHNSLAGIYSALARGETPELHAPSYADYVEYERQHLASEDFEAERRHWREQYPTAPTPLLSQRYRPESRGGLVESVYDPLCLPRAFARQLEDIAKQHQATLPTLLLCALYVYFSRVSRAEEVSIGWPVLNRPNAAFRKTAGVFISLLPVSLRLDSSASFTEALRQVSKILKNVYRHQSMPLSLIKREIGLDKTGDLRLFDISMSYQNFNFDVEFGGLESRVTVIWQKWEQIPLILHVQEFHAQADIVLDFMYNLAYFTAEDIRALQNRLMELLRAIVHNPSTLLRDLRLIPDAEIRQLQAWNDTAVDYPKDKSIIDLFEEQVEKTPENIAVVFEGRQLTYRELNQKSNQVAHYLRGLPNIPRNALMAICVERSLQMMIGLLGILKAGGAYVPIDPNYPAARIQYLLKDSAAPVLLTQSHLKAILQELTHDCVVVCLDTAGFAWQSSASPEIKPQAADLGYVIYTSGSTGNPKGVALPQSALVNLLLWQSRQAGLERQEKTLQFTTLSFDVSFQEIFSTFLNGGQLVLVAEHIRRDPLALLGYLSAERIERLFLPYIMLQQLAEQQARSSFQTLNLKNIITAGEQLRISPEIKAFLSAQPNCRLHNHYGPSESHVVTAFVLPLDQDAWTLFPPIGRPIANTRIYILGAHHQPQPPGISGELCIAGDGLARGYLNRPELTAEKFIEVELFGEKQRIYKTGDLARWLPDGNLEYLGRIDHQVKLRGFRIELGEIEAVLAQHEAVKDAVVTVYEADANKRLVAYVVVSGQEFVASSLRDWLKARLPDYMVPAHFMALDKLPLTPNGKIDRKALPAPELAAQTGMAEYIAPRTPEEEILARIWAEILGLAQVSIHDNFFDLGGDSLNVVQLLLKVENAFGIKVALPEVFDAPTVAQFAASLTRLRLAPPPVPAPMPIPRGQPVPLTFFQEWFWRHSRAQPESYLFNAIMLARLASAVDHACLQASLADLAQRHELLRATFHESDGEAAQAFLPQYQPGLLAFDASGLSQAEINEWLRAFMRQPFALDKSPAWRPALIRLAENDWLLAVCAHHLIYDARSARLFFHDLQAFYAARIQGHAHAAALPPLPLQYADYAYWERRVLAPRMEADSLEYWRGWFAHGLPQPLPIQKAGAAADFSAAALACALPPELVRRLHEPLRTAQATLSQVVMAGVAAFLALQTGHTEMVISLPFADGTYAFQNKLFGPTSRALMLRLDLSGDPSFSSLLARARAVFLAAYNGQYLPIQEGMRRLGIAPQAGQAPFHLMLSYMPLAIADMQARAPAGSFEIREASGFFSGEPTLLPPHGLVLYEQATPEGVALQGTWLYRTALFDAEYAGQLVQRFQAFMAAAAQSPDQPLSQLRNQG